MMRSRGSAPSAANMSAKRVTSASATFISTFLHLQKYQCQALAARCLHAGVTRATRTDAVRQIRGQDLRVSADSTPVASHRDGHPHEGRWNRAGAVLGRILRREERH